MGCTPEVRRILADSKPGDLRKSIAGVVGVGKSGLAEDPLSGSLVVCVNRRGHDGQLGSGERRGWCLLAKPLEPGRLHLPPPEAKPELSRQVCQLRFAGSARGGRPCLG
jgi:transposase